MPHAPQAPTSQSHANNQAIYRDVVQGAANGGAVLAAQAMGADMAYIGSPFIATTEARASDAYKQAVVDAHANDIVYSNYFTGIHGNYLKPSIAATTLVARTPLTFYGVGTHKLTASSGAFDLGTWTATGSVPFYNLDVVNGVTSSRRHTASGSRPA